MPWDRKRLLGYVETIQLILGVTDKHLYNYVLTNHILTPLWSGFVLGDSTTFQLLHTYHMFCEAIDNGKEVKTVFCDTGKAFDMVWHKTS